METHSTSAIAPLNSEYLHRLAFDAWKFQVEQYWTRSSYYVVFQLAFAAGIWKIFEAHHRVTSAFLSLGAIVFTALWVLNNERLNEYINYYWRRLKEIDAAVVTDEKLQVFAGIHRTKGLEKRRYVGNYRQYARALPPIFFAGWVYMLVWSLLSIVPYCLMHP